MIDQRGGRPGAVGGEGVQVEVDAIHRIEGQRLRRGCARRDLTGGCAGRVGQGEFLSWCATRGDGSCWQGV
jgi:hypothetical protein